jgi:hypothetical protein
MLAHLAIRAGKIPIPSTHLSLQIKVVVTIGKRKLDSKPYKVDSKTTAIKFSDKFTK